MDDGRSGTHATSITLRAGALANEGTLGAGTIVSPLKSKSSVAAKRRFVHWELALYALLTALVVGAWQFSKLDLFKSEDNVGYWLGVVGGVMMLALFTYPLRKHVRAFAKVGPLRHWFMMHMVFGIAGPLLILVHSTFKVGSMNAAIALTCMIVVALSGIVGRFLYRHIHRGFLGEKSTLRELQIEAGFEHDMVKSRFHFVPSVEIKLLDFETRVLQGDAKSILVQLQRVFVLPVRQRVMYYGCRGEVESSLERIARHRGWKDADLQDRKRRARALLRDYLAAVVNVAQFSAYERLFSLWHVLHIPFVYVLVISAIAHVIAVHIY